MKQIIIVTGGSGFVGTNLIEYLLKKTKLDIISIDNYLSGSKSNHISNKRVKYIKEDTKNISKILDPYKKKIKVLFHFGEFSRIYQSFLKMNQCIQSNSIGTNAVFDFCLKNKIKLIYSATSASLGNKGKDKNLSPYAFTKAKNLEFLMNLKNWFNFKYEVIFFIMYMDLDKFVKETWLRLLVYSKIIIKEKNLYRSLNQEVNLDDLLIFWIQSKFVIKHGKIINVHIIVFQTKKVTQ